MTAKVRIRRHLDSEVLHLPELRELLGRDVEIVVSPVEDDGREDVRDFPLAGSVKRYDNPFDPAAEEDWEAMQ
jgi:hypothetical protein